MHNVQFQVVLLTVDCVLAGRVEVELDASSCKLSVNLWVEKVDCASGQEILSVIKPNLVGSSSPNILLRLRFVHLVVVFVLGILEVENHHVWITASVSE